MLGDLEHSEGHRDFAYRRRIMVKKAKGAFCRMSRGRESGPKEF